MNVETTNLPGVVIVTPQIHGDERGFFMETFNAAKTASQGVPTHFVQDNHSRSRQGVLRGMHYQYPQWQGKLVRVIAGEIYDVAVDLRAGSATYGQWFGLYLNDANRQQLYVPPGFAHGFCVMSEIADVAYKCTSDYQPQQDFGLRWNDPTIGIDWPIENPLLSDKDVDSPLLSELPTLSVESV